MHVGATKRLMAALVTGLVTGGAAQATLLVYEPFAHTYSDGSPGVGALAGGSGALGTSGGWTTFDNNNDWYVHQEGNLSGVNLNGTNGPNLWDGTVGNLQTSGGYAGIPNPTSVSQLSTFNGNLADHMDASIALAASVTSTFTTGTTTWFSFVSVRGYNANPAAPSLMISSDPFTNDSRGSSMQNNGTAIGGGGAFPRYNNFDALPRWFDDGGAATSTAHISPGGYLSGVLGGHDGIITGAGGTGTTSDGVLDDATQTTPWTGGDIGVDYGVPNIVVGKIEWDADTGGEDIITVVSFLQTDVMDLAAFNALVAAKPALSSANWASNKPNLDQTAFDTLTLAGGKFFVDEIRLATTFGEAVPYVPEPGALSLLALGGMALLRRRRAA